MTAKQRGVVGPLRTPAFRWLFAGQFASTIGDYCYAVALPWFVLSTHGGTVLLGTVLACYGVPRAALMPVGGVLADRYGQRLVMLIADGVRFVVLIALMLAAIEHDHSAFILIPIAAVLGAGEGAFLPASMTITPSLLPEGQLQAGNAFLSASLQLGMLLGAAVGGAIVGAAGPVPAFGADALSFAISAGSLALIRVRRAQPADAKPTTTVPAARTDSITRFLRKSALFQVVLLVAVAANLTTGGDFSVALPTLAHQRYGAGGYGTILAIAGAGALIGTLLPARLGQVSRPAMVAYGAYLVEAVAITLLPFLGGLPGAAAAAAVFAFCNGFGNVLIVTWLQRWIPGRLLGRAMSLVMLASLGSFPVSVAVTGVLVRHLGSVVMFPIGGAVLACAILAGISRKEMRLDSAAQLERAAGPPEVGVTQ